MSKVKTNCSRIGGAEFQFLMSLTVLITLYYWDTKISQSRVSGGNTLMGVVGVIAEFLRKLHFTHRPIVSGTTTCAGIQYKKRQGAKLGHNKYHGYTIRSAPKKYIESTIQASAKIWPALAIAWPTAKSIVAPHGPMDRWDWGWTKLISNQIDTMDLIHSYPTSVMHAFACISSV